jgi:Sulfotransferase domain
MKASQLVPQAARPLARRTYRRLEQRTARWRMEPAFIVIGGQRCGTTTIFKSLAENPQVLAPPVDKGTDYYTMYRSRGLDWYRAHFPLRLAARRRTPWGPAVAFEACTYYLFHPYAIERLAEDYPGIKLVAMLRDPVERAFSAYKHEVARGYETESDFCKALELEDGRVAGEAERLRDPDYHSFAYRHHAYLRRGQFAEQLERVFAHYPGGQVHIMKSETFFADPAGEYRRLTDFLGLGPWAPDAFEQHNARPSNPMPEDARALLEQHFAPHEQRLEALLAARG